MRNPNFRLSTKRMADIVGKKDHTTILSAMKVTRDLIKFNPEFKEELIDMHLKIYGDLRYYIHEK